MIHARNIFLIAGSALVFSLAARAQQPPKVQMPASPAPDVTVTPFDAARFPIFKDSFTGKKAGLEFASFVLTNNADESIIAIDVEMLITDSTGQRRRNSFKSDSLLSPSAWAVAGAHDNLLVAPGIFLSESTQKRINSGAGHIGFSDSGYESEFITAAQITISIDCLIFEGGEVVGPNLQRFTDELQARPIAAQAIVQTVQSALKAGQDLPAALSPFLNAPSRRDDFVGKQESQFARQLLHSPNVDDFLAILEKIAAAPRFYRPGGGSV